MKKPLKRNLDLVDQRNALTLYLDALLNEVEVDEESDEGELDSSAEEAPLTLSTPEPALLQLPPADTAGAVGKETPHVSSPSVTGATVTSSKAPLVTMDATLSPAGLQPQGSLAGESDTSAPEGENSERSKRLNAPPAWAVPRFQVLTFSLDKLQVAAPLDQLNGIIPLPEHVTSLPGHSAWFLGLVRNRGKNVQVVDLAKVISKGRFGARQPNDAQATKYVLLVDEGRWGILCNAISTVLTLEPNQVTWRQSTQFDFFLGTVVEKMQSILSVERLVERLNGRSI